MYEAVIIGAGIYGCLISIYLSEKKKLKKILIIEKEKNLFPRASKNNQARVHNGYHYPRSIITAYRSHINLNKFIDEYQSVIKQNCKMYYAIAKGSKTNPNQFLNFCNKIGVKINLANKTVRKLFNSRLVEEIFEVEEYVFDYIKFRNIISEKLKENNIEVFFNSEVTGIEKSKEQSVNLVKIKDKNFENIFTKKIFNCTYSGINRFSIDNKEDIKIKHEITEIALVKPPYELSEIGITLMDGPFFSIIPYPSNDLHSLTHVKYTPHLYWNDDKNINPYDKLDNYHKKSFFNYMLRDSCKYLPIINKSIYKESLFEIKTVLSNEEISDGRPIIFKKDKNNKDIFNILGGKIDNIFDCFKRLDNEIF